MRIRASMAGAALGLWMALAGSSFAVTQAEADAMYAAQDWRGAATAYEGLLRANDDSANNWYNLGRSRHALGDASGARRAYMHALNHPTPGRVRYHLARALMTLGRREEALRWIQQLVGTGVNSALILSTAEFESLTGVPEFVAVVAAQTPCNMPEYRQFDFWLGEWDIVATNGGGPLGRNSITREQDGCVVQERYSTAGFFTGMSMNFYDVTRQLWHQTWMSNQGGVLYLEGRLNADGAMELSDRGLPGAAAGVINRTIWAPLAEGGLRQHWERSTDDGATWTTVFDGRYVRRSEGGQ